MLRITISEEGPIQKWVLQGWLIGPWVSELNSTWRDTQPTRAGRRCIVDLRDLVFVDPAGELALKAMLNDGAELVGACGTYNKQVIAGLERNSNQRIR